MGDVGEVGLNGLPCAVSAFVTSNVGNWNLAVVGLRVCVATLASPMLNRIGEVASDREL